MCDGLCDDALIVETEARVSGIPYRVDKPWGYEIIWAKADRYVGKILHIEPGHVLSLQYHNEKDESIYILSGRLRLHLEDDAGAMTVREMTTGESARVPTHVAT